MNYIFYKNFNYDKCIIELDNKFKKRNELYKYFKLLKKSNSHIDFLLKI